MANPTATPGYGANTNDPYTQIPKALPASAYGQASAVPPLKIRKTPSYVIINSGSLDGNTYKFIYGLTASLDTTLDQDNPNWVTASGMTALDKGPMRLDINPEAWCTSNAAHVEATGDVTFVYQGGL
tara:strand:- start:90 stop:470 length:381 start_codon:yes stop_codon:yes gene_type:complete